MLHKIMNIFKARKFSSTAESPDIHVWSYQKISQKELFIWRPKIDWLSKSQNIGFLVISLLNSWTKLRAFAKCSQLPEPYLMRKHLKFTILILDYKFTNFAVGLKAFKPVQFEQSNGKHTFTYRMVKNSSRLWNL